VDAAAAARPAKVDLDALNAHWRLAFNSAEDALAAARNCGKSLRFAPNDLGDLGHRLALERSGVATLMTELSREERVKLHRPLSAPRATKRMLGLPNEVLACVFDLDGVLTATAAVHAAAWGETFNAFLLRRAERTHERFAPFRPFDPSTEYREHLHGRPRVEGVHAFLASRGIRLHQGHPDDPPDAETVYGLANRKNLALVQRLDREGVTAFADSRRYLEAAREAGLRCAVVSASANAETIIERAGLSSLIDARVDGNTISAEHLKAKPAPDTLLAACRELATPPRSTVLFDTTPAGIDAGRAAGCALVVGVERTGQAATFRAHGADVVVPDLGALLDPDETFRAHGADLVVTGLGALLDPSLGT
jgi:beta-phosphoglucomutase family hydrolase